MVVIIGGGIFGLAIGWTLARANCPVTLFERDQVGHGATWAAAGMLMPWKLSSAFNQDLFELQRAGYELWPDFAAALSAASAVELHFETDGRCFVALDDKAARRLSKQYCFHQQVGFPLEWLDGAEARRREPNLGPNVRAAIFSALGHRVDNRRLVLALRQAFLRAGGVLQEHSRVIEILSDRQRVQGVRLAGKRVPAGTVILAAGAWSGQIGGLPQSLPQFVEPLKGQTLTLRMPRHAPLIRQPLIGPVYLVPRRDGRLILGTTVEEEAGFDTQPTAGGVLDILTKAQEIIPRIDALPIIEMSAGLRPTGPERLPVLGPTELQGLILASGGHSFGLLLSPIVAQAISHLTLTGQAPAIIKPFVPS